MFLYRQTVFTVYIVYCIFLLHCILLRVFLRTPHGSSVTYQRWMPPITRFNLRSQLSRVCYMRGMNVSTIFSCSHPYRLYTIIQLTTMTRERKTFCHAFACLGILVVTGCKSCIIHLLLFNYNNNHNDFYLLTCKKMNF